MPKQHKEDKTMILLKKDINKVRNLPFYG
jgi:hypothetical protein